MNNYSGEELQNFYLYSRYKMEPAPGFTPEELIRFKEYESQILKQWYQANKEYKKLYSK